MERISTADRILNATVQLYTQVGREGLTVRKIADLAGCSNTTILNIFKNKNGLIDEALRRELKGLDRTIPSRPSDNLEQDLVSFAERYYAFYSEQPFVMMVFPEIMREPRLQKILIEEQTRTVAALVWFFSQHQHQGAWNEELDSLGPNELHEVIGTPFLGGIYWQVQLTKAGLLDREFDPKLYVRRFLEGWQAKDNKKSQSSSP